MHHLHTTICILFTKIEVFKVRRKKLKSEEETSEVLGERDIKREGSIERREMGG